jgi:hypothetical protein
LFNSTATDAFIGALDFINTSNAGTSGSGRYGIASIRGFTTNAGATNTGGGYLAFVTKADGGSGAERMRITSGGRVLIGTPPPTESTYQLDVNGTGRFSGNATNGAPFLTLNATSANSTFNWVSTAFASNLAAGNNLIHFIGQSGSTKNAAYLGFKYAGSGSNDNILTLGLYAVDNVLNINGNGNVGIGLTTPQSQLHMNGTLTFSEVGYDTVRLHTISHNHSAGSNPNNFISFNVSNGFNTTAQRVKINGDGDLIVTGSLANFTIGGSGAEVFFGRNATNYITANGGAGSTIRIISNTNGVQLSNGATSWVAVSDENLKVMTEWKTFINPLEKIISLRAGTSRYKTDSEDISRSFLIAQDVQKVLPEAVSVDEDGILGLRYTEVIPLMIAAIQDQQKQIEELKLLIK